MLMKDVSHDGVIKMKQLIIARKDLNMSPGKLAAQVSHASMAFLTNKIKQNYWRRYSCEMLPTKDARTGERRWYKRGDLDNWCIEAYMRGEEYFYCRPIDPNDPNGKLELCEPNYQIETTLLFNKDIWNDWICGSFTKIICEAKNKYQLEKAITFARELGLEENKDFFLIKDNCYTELTPEEIDENGVGRTLTCIGFRPLPDDICAQLSKKYQLYR